MPLVLVGFGFVVVLLFLLVLGLVLVIFCFLVVVVIVLVGGFVVGCFLMEKKEQRWRHNGEKRGIYEEC